MGVSGKVCKRKRLGSMAWERRVDSGAVMDVENN